MKVDCIQSLEIFVIKESDDSIKELDVHYSQNCLAEKSWKELWVLGSITTNNGNINMDIANRATLTKNIYYAMNNTIFDRK